MSSHVEHRKMKGNRVALITIAPFNYSAFVNKTENSILGIIDHFNNKEPEFWLNTFRKYNFRKQDYQAGENIRLEFNNALSSCSGDEELYTVANRILEWGGMQPLNDAMKLELMPSLSLLRKLANEELVDFNKICVERLASITKIYEMSDLDNWVIYDSYCARGLQWLISEYWKASGSNKNEELLKLPWPPGKAKLNRPIAGFPRMGDKPPLQKRLAFIYGSWLCKAIAERLANNCKNDFHWRPYHVEMLAFRIGHRYDL